jgi:hypothetical protein
MKPVVNAATHLVWNTAHWLGITNSDEADFEVIAGKFNKNNM